MGTTAVQVARSLAAAMPGWVVTFHSIDNDSSHSRPFAVVIDEFGDETWVSLDISIGADPTESADQVARRIMDNEGWSQQPWRYSSE
jgi:hypothetical protein